MELSLATLLVREYQPAIDFFVNVLQFDLAENSEAIAHDGQLRRWVVVRPPGARTGLLLARAEGDEQRAAVGRQCGGRVGFFLRVDDFPAAYERIRASGVEIETPPRHEAYGDVAVFKDCEGGSWDLLGPPAPRADV